MPGTATAASSRNATTDKIGIALVGADHRVMSANRHLLEFLGRSAGELIGMQFEEFTFPDDVTLDAHLATRLFAGEIESYELVKRFVKKDGTIVSAQITASVLRDQRGTINAGIAIVRPVAAPREKLIPITEAADIERIRRAMFAT